MRVYTVLEGEQGEGERLLSIHMTFRSAVKEIKRLIVEGRYYDEYTRKKLNLWTDGPSAYLYLRIEKFNVKE